MPRLRVRSSKPITKLDLRRLRDSAIKELDSFFNRRYDLYKFRSKVIAIALCQGAANHYVKRKTGVKDFDIFFFFSEYDRRLINRRHIKMDSKLHKFGIHPEDVACGFQGRRIHFLRRAIDTDLVRAVLGDPRKVVVGYLERGRTKTAQQLTGKAVVGLWPDNLFAKVLWPRRSI